MGEKTGEELHKEGMARLLHCSSEHEEIDKIIAELEGWIADGLDGNKFKTLLSEARLEKYRLRQKSDDRIKVCTGGGK